MCPGGGGVPATGFLGGPHLSYFLILAEIPDFRNSIIGSVLFDICG